MSPFAVSSSPNGVVAPAGMGILYSVVTRNQVAKG